MRNYKFENMMVNESAFWNFVDESNMIEGITRDVEESEVEALVNFLYVPQPEIMDMVELVRHFEPTAKLRSQLGMDVRIGNHYPPSGGMGVVYKLEGILLNLNSFTVWENHCEYETLHPFMDGNGRSGRALWLHQMVASGEYNPRLGFLHSFYYQTLGENHGRS